MGGAEGWHAGRAWAPLLRRIEHGGGVMMRAVAFGIQSARARVHSRLLVVHEQSHA